MNWKRINSDKVNRYVITFLIAALVLANVGFIVTFGRAILELVFVLRDYFIGLTEAIEKGSSGEGVDSTIDNAGGLPFFRCPSAPLALGDQDVRKT